MYNSSIIYALTFFANHSTMIVIYYFGKNVLSLDILTLYTQIVEMFLMIGIGMLCYKKGIITDGGSSQISTFVMTFVAPAVIIHSFQRSYDPAMLKQLVTSFALSVLLLVISIGIAAAIFPKRIKDYADKRMSVIFSNNGFMALPLLQALFGDNGVFIGSINIVVTNILIWTYGIWLLSRASGRAVKTDWKKIVFNPGTLGFYIGLLIFLTSTQLPTVLTDTITFFSNLNTPLAMVVLGVYLAQSNLSALLRDRSAYLICAGRLLLIPLITIAVILLLPFDSEVSRVLLISVSTPCAVASSMFAQMCGTNYRYAGSIIAFSTILSAVTMPVVLSLYQLFV